MAKLLTSAAAAKLLHVKPQTLRRWEANGSLPFKVHYTRGGHRRYDEQDVLNFAATLKTKKAKTTGPSLPPVPQIQVLTSIEAVRARPGMYIGSTGQRGLFQLFKEIFDNALHEAVVGACNQIKVNISSNQTITITDNGRGFPANSHPPSTNGLHVIDYFATNLHSGYSSYLNSGLIGVGLTAVNALSKWMKLETQYGLEVLSSTYKKGVITSSAKPLYKLSPGEQAGTKISWQYDPAIFTTQAQYPIDQIVEYLKTQTHLCPGLICQLEAPGIFQEFYNPNGLADFFFNSAEYKKNHFELISLSSKDTDQAFDVHFTWNKGNRSFTESFVNYFKTYEGGSHVNGVIKGITDALTTYGQNLGHLSAQQKCQPKQITKGLLLALHVITPSTYFNGKTHGRLADPQLQKEIAAFIKEQFLLYLNDPANKLVSQRLLAHALNK